MEQSERRIYLIRTLLEEKPEADIGAVLEKLYDRKNSQGDVAVSEEIC